MRKSKVLQKLENLHVDCEINFVRLLKLMPNMDEGNKRRFLAGAYGDSWLEIEITGADRYTRFIQVTGRMAEMPWGGEQCMSIRLYLDARMAEVVSSGAQKVRLLRYPYPNDQMYSSDEKNQINRFLSKWLEHFIKFGHPMDEGKIEKHMTKACE